MKKIVPCSLTYVLCAVAAMLVALLVAGCVLAMAWPWWVGIFLMLAVIGLCAGVWLVKNLMVKRRERTGLSRGWELDGTGLQNLSDPEHARCGSLQDSWQLALETLRHSHLKSQGDPLYVLPWYLVMGESGSGKTAAIGNARLSSPLAETREDCGTVGTRNCQWSFLEQAILIDTAGRYTVSVDQERDPQEWQKVLSLLVKSRKREPLDGLIVTVAADRLIRAPMQELAEYGRQVRRRIDELMRVTGVRFPVYTLVTKCDLIDGMNEFVNRLPRQSLDQPMGKATEEFSGDPAGCLERFFANIGERLKWLRMLLVHGTHPGTLPAGVLLFPDEIGKLRPGLTAFVQGAFQENRYQDTPLFRGLYFGSACRQTPASGTPSAENRLGEGQAHLGTERGVFLHDFFEKVLPNDRRLLTPTVSTSRWRSFSRNLGLVSWVSIGLALCGVLSYSFARNLATIKDASAVIAVTPELNGNPVSDLAAMDGYRQMILKVERSNRNWWIPRFGLNESLKAEAALKTRFCRQFQDRFLAGFDRNMTDAIAGFSKTTSDDLSGRYLLHLCRRITLLKARLGGAGLDPSENGQLSWCLESAPRPGNDAAAAKKMGDMYLNYLVWRTDGPELNKEVQRLQSLLKQLFTARGGSFAWLLELVNRQHPGEGIALRTFWGGSRTLQAEPVIAPAFTRKGKEAVTALVNEIVTAYPESGSLEREMGSFENWYRDGCFAAWQTFAAAFPKGVERLNGAKEWQGAAAVMATDQGPYASFVSRATAELEPFCVVEALPSWLSLLYRYQALKIAGPASGGIASAAQSGKRIAGTLGKLVGRQATGSAAPEPEPSSAGLIQEYAGAQTQISTAAKSRNQARLMAQQLFGDDSGAGSSPFYQAASRGRKVNSQLAQGKAPDEIFSRLLSGPIDFYGTFVRQETACALQRQWEENVLKEVQGAGDAQTLQYLLNKDGPVWKFVAASADPFIGWDPKRGYYSKTALGGTVPFEPGFYAFLTRGAKAKIAAAAPVKQSYDLTVRGLPTDANSEARIKPQRTHLELQCATGAQTIDNLNFPVHKTFVWSPESCGEVVFQIEIGDTTLTKRYKGAHGLVEFLRDFPGGRRTFSPREFPVEKQALERMGVRFLRANYQLSGGRDILSVQASKSLPGQVPARIARCWD